MDDNEYIEGLAWCLCENDGSDSPVLTRRRWNKQKEMYYCKAQAIADYHREHGYRVVPYEPTYEMKRACLKEWGYEGENDTGYAVFPDIADTEDGYKAMLDAYAKGESDE